MKSNKKKKIIILVVVAILILTSYFVYKAIKNHKVKWKSIAQNFIADFNNDGNAEMLIIYDYHKKSAAMKLVDIQNGKIIWKSSCHPSHIHESKRIVVTDSILAISYYDYVNSPYKNTNENYLGVEAFNKKTGEKIWDIQVDPNREYGLFFNLLSFKNTILFHTQKLQEGKCYLTSLSQKNGEKLWEIGFPMEFMYHPQYLSDSVYLVDGTYGTYELNIFTGDTVNLEKNGNIRDIFPYDKHKYYFIKNSVLHHNKNNGEAIIVNNDTLRIDRDTSKFYSEIGLYNNSLIAILNEYQDNKSEIASFPINSAGKKYSFSIDDATLETAFYYEVMNKEPEICGFHLIQRRYIPLIKQRGVDEFTKAKQIILFDLEEGKISWESQPFIPRGESFYSKDILYYKGYYIISVDLRNKYKNATQLVLNGNTGKFYKAIHLGPDTLNACNNFRNGYNMFYENYFYGSTWDVAWCLTYPEMDIVYSTDNELTIFNDSSFAKEKLGIMPWE